ncbi:MAG: DUF6443 domain-containing protein, partial [Saprospiraceae bacterium]
MQTLKTFKTLLTAGWLVITTISIGQNALVPNFDLSPDATSIGKYGYFPVSTYTGQPNINIPIKTLSSNGIEVDVSLQYDASGIMVDRHPGWVGQNWSLMSGGAITRTVNGFEDERGITLNINHFNVNISYIDFALNGSGFTEAQTDTYEELRQFSLSRAIFTSGVPLIIDSEPDMFHFKVGDISGRFYIDDDGIFKVISDQNIKVEFDFLNPNNYQYPVVENVIGQANKKFHKVIKGFKLIDDTGRRYTFGYDENAIEYTYPFFRQYSFNNNSFFGYNNWVSNTWHLTKIEDEIGNTVYTFDYERSYFTAQLYENLSSQKVECKVSGEWTLISQSSGPSASGSLLSPVYLSRITTNKNEELIFKKSPSTQLPIPFTTLFQQESTDVESALGAYYNEPTLIPFPYLQTDDYYSYDPVAAMSNPINGLRWNKLDSIIYKQNNERVHVFKLDYNNTISERLNLLSVKHLPITNDPNETPFGHELIYNQFASLPGYLSNMNDHFGYYNGTNEYVASGGYFNFVDLQNNYQTSRGSNQGHLQKGQLTELKYPTGGRSTFEYEWHDYASVLSNDRQSLSAESGQVGGLRIKTIANYDGIQVASVSNKRYFYKKNFQNGGNESSGIYSFKPAYVFIDWLSPTTSYSGGGIRHTSFSRNILSPLYNQFENPVNYSEVVEMNEDGSYSIYKFTSYIDIKDDLPYATLALSYSPYMRFQEKNNYRGRLLSHTMYNNVDSPVKSVTNHYNNSIYSIGSTTEYNISVNAFYNLGCVPSNYEYYYNGNAIKIYNFRPYIDSVVTNTFYSSGTVNTTESYQYAFPTYFGNKYRFLMQKSIANADGKVYMDYFKHSFDHTSSYSGQPAMMTSLVAAHRFPVISTEKKVDGGVVDGTQDLYASFSGKLLPKYQLRYEGTWINGTFSAVWDTSQEIGTYDLGFMKPTQMTKKGWSPETITLNSRGYSTLWQYLNHDRSYAYFGNDFLQTFTDVDGQYTEFEYDFYSRLKKSTNHPKNVANTYEYRYSTSASDKSYIKTKSKYPLSSGSAIDSIVNYSYVDGLGRGLQSIHKNGAPNGDDVISKTTYDDRSRPYRSYEPIAVGGNNGNYYTGAFGGGYTQQLYHPDPLSRVSETTPPAWQTTYQTYGTNTSSLTHPDGQVYPASSLMLSTTTDPDGKSTDIYTDKLGRAVLRRQRDA